MVFVFIVKAVGKKKRLIASYWQYLCFSSGRIPTAQIYISGGVTSKDIFNLVSNENVVDQFFDKIKYTFLKLSHLNILCAPVFLIFLHSATT